jgi:hypothetical protein
VGIHNDMGMPVHKVVITYAGGQVDLGTIWAAAIVQHPLPGPPTGIRFEDTKGQPHAATTTLEGADSDAYLIVIEGQWAVTWVLGESRPDAAPGVPLQPAPPAGRPCGCPPDDLRCAMRCSQRAPAPGRVPEQL